MREIKFRGKAITGIWVYGGISIKSHGTFIIDENLPYDDCCAVIPETVGEFTGILDSSGQEIYEDDIMRIEALHFDTSGPLPDILNVKFYDGTFQLFRGNHPLVGLHLGYVKKGKVIGNISDNSDWLETIE